MVPTLPMEDRSADGHAAPALIALRGVSKTYGPVRALAAVDFTVRSGEVIGLVGHNGAGKSTLMNVISGTVARSTGRFELDGTEVGDWSGRRSQGSGIRCVFQELSLCTNLSAAENTRVIHRPLRGLGWRRRAAALILEKLDEIFPGHGIDPQRRVSSLSIGERQMVEIARAFTQTDIALRCVILDEPTSALGHEATEQLLSHIRGASSGGVAIILITHRLNEILAVCDRAVVMLDGRVVAERPRDGLTRSALVELSGHIETAAPRDARTANDAAGRAARVDDPGRGAGDLAIRAGAGSIVGFAGLDGHGQRQRLRRIFKATGARGIPTAFVAGDRGHEGVFALWSIADNLTIRSLDALGRAGFVRRDASRSLASTWAERLKVKAPSIDTPIVALSGGNQQKVLFARALASDAEVIFLDDPMRGVDVGTKQEVYRLIRAEADRGRCFVWYTTELEELSNCERIYVFREGRAAVELTGADAEPGRILEASFGGGHV